MTHEIIGACACGEIRFRLLGAPIVTHGCHCRDCQQATGSAFAVNAMIETDRVALEAGAPERVETHSGFTDWRCARCQVTAWSHHPKLGPKIAFVAAGILEGDHGIAPDIHCYTRSKHPWVVLPPGVPAFEADYDHATVWSAESKIRMAAVMT